MKTLLTQLADLFADEFKAEGLLSAAKRVLGGAQALRFARAHRELLAQPVFSQHVATHDNEDPLFYLSHRHYLSNRLSYLQRIQCANTHYAYEGSRHDEPYIRAVCRTGGLSLWSSASGGKDYAIRLCRTTKPSNEGGNSIVLEADGVCLSEMSFIWLAGSVIGCEGDILPFITRNQSVHPQSDHLRRFRADFPQNSPSYFCLAAMHGITQAHGKPHVAGIRHDCQIAYEPCRSQSFRNSYTEFWKAFGGAEIGGHAYLMPVPWVTAPIQDIRPKHRSRALNRRGHWSSIARSAADATTARLGGVMRGQSWAAGVSASVFIAHLPLLMTLPPPM